MGQRGAALARQASERMAVDAAAGYLGLSTSTLNKMRTEGRGPRFLRLGNRCFYRKTDLDAYVEGQVVETADSRRSAA